MTHKQLLETRARWQVNLETISDLEDMLSDLADQLDEWAYYRDPRVVEMRAQLEELTRENEKLEKLLPLEYRLPSNEDD